jgi:xanthine dehydrogenase accessory factor
MPTRPDAHPTLCPSGSNHTAFEAMSDRHSCVLILGIGETASAIARELFLADHIVAMHQAAPPPDLCRKMTFSDAWFDGSSVLEGVEARRADLVAEFMLGLRSRMFIPVLTHPLPQILERWPWEAVVDAEMSPRREPFSVKNLAGLTIGVAPGSVPGETCDLAVDAYGKDPGAIRRSGDGPGPRPEAEPGASEPVRATAAGIFSMIKDIGNVVEAGEAFGSIDGVPALAPYAGRIRGIIKHGRAVAIGTPLADIAASTAAQVAGMTARNRLVARGVAFAIEMQAEGWAPFSWDAFQEGGGGFPL